ncbi:MAG: ankyrin repeat domain-containing protein [Micavibrio sp.]|nr:ankyrin repeat domain-containing protein [Micavibrio sp.]
MAQESKKQAAKPANSAPRSIADAIGRNAGIYEVSQMLKAGHDPMLANARGRTPMDAAMERHDYDVALLLLDAGATPPAYEGEPDGPPVYDKTRFGARPELDNETALTYQIKHANSFDAAFRIIANGADVNKPNSEGRTPLSIAISRKWPHVATQLVKLNAWADPAKKDPDEIVDTTTGATRLLSVIMEGHNAGAVLLLLQQGADPNKADNHGLTPLALARALRWDGVENMLIKHGAIEAPFPDPNQNTGAAKDTPLLVYACSYQSAHNNYKLALLEAGAAPDARDASGKTAAHWSAIYGRTDVLQDLEEHGADLTTPDTKGNLTPLHWACYNGREHAAAFLLPRTSPEALNAPDALGKRILHYTATRAGTGRLIRHLVNLGAQINQRDDKGATPLDVAVQTRDPAVVRAVLESGADTAKVEADSTHNAPLFTLVNSPNDNNAAIARLLLDHGANPNALARESYNGPQQGDHLLYFAVSYRNYAVATALLQNGADPHATAAKGESAMHHCLHLRQVEGVELLLKYGFDINKPFEYSQKWHGGGETREEHHNSSALQEARKLVEKFGADDAYGDMLRMLENHAPRPPQPQTPKPMA